MTVAVTGATGFVGTAVVRRLLDGGTAVRVGVRARSSTLPDAVEQVLVGDLTAPTGLDELLAGAETVVHLAARVHVMRDTAADPMAEFRRVNTQATRDLARASAAAGVRRFIFLSSIKVNGEVGVYSEADTPKPIGHYAISKYEAEEALRAIQRETGIETTIIRPPLVYGPGVRANFRALARAVAAGVPLPFGAVDNRRSLVAVDNLADLIATAIAHPAAANEVFLVSDGEDLSTADLIRRIGHALGRPARLVPVPSALLMAGARAIGRHDLAQRLLGSLRLEIGKARTTLGWTPPVPIDVGIARAVRDIAVPRRRDRLR